MYCLSLKSISSKFDQTIWSALQKLNMEIWDKRSVHPLCRRAASIKDLVFSHVADQTRHQTTTVWGKVESSACFDQHHVYSRAPTGGAKSMDLPNSIPKAAIPIIYPSPEAWKIRSLELWPWNLDLILIPKPKPKPYMYHSSSGGQTSYSFPQIRPQSGANLGKSKERRRPHELMSYFEASWSLQEGLKLKYGPKQSWPWFQANCCKFKQNAS